METEHLFKVESKLILTVNSRSSSNNVLSVYSLTAVLDLKSSFNTKESAVRAGTL